MTKNINPEKLKSLKTYKESATSALSGNLETSDFSGFPCVYIIRCKDGTLYTGWTNDIKKRLETHNSGKGAKYTRGRTPVTLVYLEFLKDKPAATKREASIKKLPRSKKHQLIESELNLVRSK